MDGLTVNTSHLERLAAFVRAAALAAGYDIDRVNSGDKTRLARDASMSVTTLSRLLAAERMPDAKYLAPLAKALNTNVLDMLVEAGIISDETRSQEAHKHVPSRHITPDDVADAWGVDKFGREMVHAMFARLTNAADPHHDTGGAEAQQG